MRDVLTEAARRSAAGPDARRERVLDPQAGGPPRRANSSAPSTSPGSRSRSGAGTPKAWPPSAAAIRASVASGENLTGLEQFRPLLAAGAVDIVQTAAVWGVTHFLRVAALAHAHDLPVSPIGNTPVGLLHAATSVPNHLASELQDLRPPVGVTIDLHVEDGAFVLGDSPGLGIRVDEDAIARLPASARPPRRRTVPTSGRSGPGQRLLTSADHGRPY